MTVTSKLVRLRQEGYKLKPAWVTYSKFLVTKPPNKAHTKKEILFGNENIVWGEKLGFLGSCSLRRNLAIVTFTRVICAQCQYPITIPKVCMALCFMTGILLAARGEAAGL